MRVMALLIDNLTIFHADHLTSASIGNCAPDRLASLLEISIKTMTQKVDRDTHGDRKNDCPKAGDQMLSCYH